MEKNWNNDFTAMENVKTLLGTMVLLGLLTLTRAGQKRSGLGLDELSGSMFVPMCERSATLHNSN